MKAYALSLAALVLAACQADTKNLNDKIDKLDKKLDAILAQGGRPGAAQAPRQQRPEPDRAKTYAVSIDGDPFDAGHRTNGLAAGRFVDEDRVDQVVCRQDVLAHQAARELITAHPPRSNVGIAHGVQFTPP